MPSDKGSELRPSALIVRPFSWKGRTYERGDEAAFLATASARVIASLTALGNLRAGG